SWHSTAELRPRAFVTLTALPSADNRIPSIVVVIDLLFMPARDGRRVELATEEERGPGDDDPIGCRQLRADDDAVRNGRAHLDAASLEAMRLLRCTALQVNPRPAEGVEHGR